MSESPPLDELQQQIRLSAGEIKAIQSVMDIHVAALGAASLWLFGSRTDPEKSGGDIDLFLELGSRVANASRLIHQIRLALYDEMGWERPTEQTKLEVSQ